MVVVEIVYTSPEVQEYLTKHQLISQFQKAVEKLKNGNHSGLDFKKREPKSLEIWSFRITKKYRAWSRKKGNELTVYLVDDHQ